MKFSFGFLRENWVGKGMDFLIFLGGFVLFEMGLVFDDECEGQVAFGKGGFVRERIDPI